MTPQQIENRIKAEYKKHQRLDWAKIAALKIYAQMEEDKNNKSKTKE